MGLRICLAEGGGRFSNRRVTRVCRLEGKSIEKVMSIDDIDGRFLVLESVVLSV